MEPLDDNRLYCWFVGLSLDDAVWDATTYTKNRERLQHKEITLPRCSASERPQM